MAVFRMILKRLGFLVLVVWAAGTITFFIPRISNRNPIRERFADLARTGGFSPGDLETIVASYNEKFGLDKPLMEQYFDYMGSLARFDLGVSLNQFPKTVNELILEALPWTIGLLIVTTILSFVIGNLLGALAAWPQSPNWVRNLSTSFVLLQGVPPVLLAVLLIFFIAFRLNWLPVSGSYTPGTVPSFSLEFILDMGKHQILPACALIFGSVGGWVLSMRGMGITIQGEDYVLFAEHKGLSNKTIFRDYFLRNAMLPQVTGFALALGNVVTSAIVVEQMFGLPGIGTVLTAAIRVNDFLVIYGVVLFITIAIATLMVLVELLYPLLDPRISYDN
ncbi:MAG: peptide/nickel transport system permease protein [Cellvibrionaceae bacterium]|jgi:peptide/nickel transport system permease protein